MLSLVMSFFDVIKQSSQPESNKINIAQYVNYFTFRMFNMT